MRTLLMTEALKMKRLRCREAGGHELGVVYLADKQSVKIDCFGVGDS